MTSVVVVHQWKDEQKDRVMKFANTITSMAKNKSLPPGLNLVEIHLAKNANIAVCKWEVDSLQHLMSVASSLKPDWQISAYEVSKIY